MSPREWLHAVGNGPFIGAMIFIVAVTAGSVMFAKYCVGDRAFMRTGYDFQGYVMRKCPVCVGLPKRTHNRVREIAPPEVQVHVQVVEEAPVPPPTAPATAYAASEAPVPPPAAPATASTPAVAAVAATVGLAVAAAARGEEEDEDKDMEEEEDDDDDEFLFEDEGNI